MLRSVNLLARFLLICLLLKYWWLFWPNLILSYSLPIGGCVSVRAEARICWCCCNVVSLSVTAAWAEIKSTIIALTQQPKEKRLVESNQFCHLKKCRYKALLKSMTKHPLTIHLDQDFTSSNANLINRVSSVHIQYAVKREYSPFRCICLYLCKETSWPFAYISLA